MPGIEKMTDHGRPPAPVCPGPDHPEITPGAGTGEYQGRNILISGAGGSIGSELCRQVLMFRPGKIILLENNEFSLFSIERELRPVAAEAGSKIIPVLGSVADARLVAAALHFHDIEIVLHAAAYKHVTLVEQNPIAGIGNNIFGTQTLVRAACDHGVRRFVLISSDKAVRPASVMGATKRMAEILVQDQAIRAHRTVLSIVRFGNVLESSGSVVPIFREQIAGGGPVTLTDEFATRYFMTVKEAAQLVLQAGGIARGGEVFVLDMGKPIRVRALAQRMIEAAGHTVKDQGNPGGDIEIQITGLRPGEKRHEELMVAAGDSVTAHQKIFRVTENVLSEIEVAATLKSLRNLSDAGEADAAVRVLMARVTPSERAKEERRPACCFGQAPEEFC